MESISVPGGVVTFETKATFIPDIIVPNLPPVVSSGSGQSITLPLSSVTLRGSASDSDGFIQSSIWSKVSGPNAIIVDPTNLQTAVTGLIAGNYVFRLSVTDDKGASVSSDTTIIVNAAPPISTPINFTPTQLTADFFRAGAGAEQWHGAWDVDLYSGNRSGVDKYFRFQGCELETSKGIYNFNIFNSQMREALDRGGKFAFGIMDCCDGADNSRRFNYPDGTYSSYPGYLHQEMMATIQKPVLIDGQWVVNPNSEIFLSYLFRRNQAINSYLDTTIINGVKLRDAIKYIDIRGYGNYGEWHTSGIDGAPLATSASLRRIIDSYIQGFPNQQLLAMIAGLDGGSTGWAVFPAFPEISYYILTAKNNVGEIGWRRDSLGSTESYISQILENNKIVYNGVALKTLIMNKWKTAPIHGERYGGTSMAALPDQVKLYHMCGFGNGNFNYPLPSSDTTAVKLANKVAGDWLTITSGSISANTIAINWQNNQAPAYEDWDVYFEIHSGSSVVSLPKSSFIVKGFIGTKTVTDTFSAIPSGSLYVIMKDPKGVRKPLAIAISGRQTDGSYLLK